MTTDAPPSSQPAIRAAEGRVDLLQIAGMVEPGSRVLDVGCGDGALLTLLTERLAVDGRGVEISQAGVNSCVARGLSVIQGDADSDLLDYPDDAFDYAILSQTIQATYHPRLVLGELLRIGRRVIVSFPNFGHWRIRAQLLFFGRMPMTENLREPWYDTPNIHFCTIKDFVALCDTVGAKVERSAALNSSGGKMAWAMPLAVQNLIAEQAVFLLTRNDSRGGAVSDPKQP